MDRLTDKKKKGSRIIGAFIALLIVLFFAIELVIRESRGFASGSLPGVILSMLQVIFVLLLFLVPGVRSVC